MLQNQFQTLTNASSASKTQMQKIAQSLTQLFTSQLAANTDESNLNDSNSEKDLATTTTTTTATTTDNKADNTVDEDIDDTVDDAVDTTNDPYNAREARDIIIDFMKEYRFEMYLLDFDYAHQPFGDDYKEEELSCFCIFSVTSVVINCLSKQSV